MNDADSILEQLMRLIQARQRERPAASYTTHLFDGGAEKIGLKVIEEAGEVVEAARAWEVVADENTKHHVQHEVADLVYHLMVMLAHCGLDLVDLETELARRFGISGLEEKANRKTKD